MELGECAIRGMDFQHHDDPIKYREAVEFIKRDPLSLGALVTTHKIDLLMACRNIFDELDPYAQMMEEISCISKKGADLVGHAKDPITSGLALEAFLPVNYWQSYRADVLVLGAGGSAIAITWYLMQSHHGANRPQRIIVANRSTPRLKAMERIHKTFDATVPIDYVHTPNPRDGDALLGSLKPHSLVINATGLGKDAPGSPLTDAVQFPENGIAWDFNYRGNLIFLEQARAQQSTRGLQIEDGWIYFIHGWTRVIAEVFHVDIQVRGPRFDELSKIAAQARG